MSNSHILGQWTYSGHEVNSALGPIADVWDSRHSSLIAAAPDLYHAANNALNTLIACCVPAGGCDDRKTMLEAQQMLRTACAKAIGK